MYERHGRWVHQDTAIYSDVECKQLYSLFKSMRGNEVNAVDIAAEQEKLVAEHEVKTLRTCEVLMKQLGQLLFWENLKARYARRTTRLDDLSKVMARNLKLYALIDHIMKVYDLIHKIEVSDLRLNPLFNQFIYSFQEVQKKALIARDLSSFKMLDQKLCQRLIANIKLMAKENQMVADGFQFKGKCMLAEAQKKLKANLMEHNMALQLRKRIFGEQGKLRAEKGEAAPATPANPGAQKILLNL